MTPSENVPAARTLTPLLWLIWPRPSRRGLRDDLSDADVGSGSELGLQFCDALALNPNSGEFLAASGRRERFALRLLDTGDQLVEIGKDWCVFE